MILGDEDVELVKSSEGRLAHVLSIEARTKVFNPVKDENDSPFPTLIFHEEAGELRASMPWQSG